MLTRIEGAGWLALVGGGEFSFGETREADAAWVAHAGAGPVGFLPTASGSTDYGHHFTGYLAEAFERDVEVVPIYRERDARRGRNLERIASAAAVYVGGGIADQLLAVVRESPAAEALAERLRTGGVVAAIAAGAQALGQAVRSLTGGEVLPGLGWLPRGVIETNFSPAHDRRVRALLGRPGIDWAVGLPAGAALLLGPAGASEIVGTVFTLEDPEGEWTVVAGAASGGAPAAPESGGDPEAG